MNNFDVPSWIANTVLALYKNKGTIVGNFNKDYNKEFAKGFPIGNSFQVPLPQRFLTRHGLQYNPNAINARHTTITMNEPDGVDFEWDDVEKTLNMPKGEQEVQRRYLKPAAAALRQLAESQAAQFAYQNSPNVIGALGTTPSTFDDTSAAALQMFTEKGAPESMDRALIIPPLVNRKVKQSAIGYMNPQSDISKQYRTGAVGMADTFDFYTSMSLYRHTAGTWAGAVTVSGAVVQPLTPGPVAGVSSMLVNCTSGDTFKKGDKFSIAAVLPTNLMTRRTYGPSTQLMTFTILADVTASASTATITFYPPIDGPGSQYQNVDSLPANTAALTLWPGTTSPNGKSGVVGIAYDENAFAVVTRPLPQPKGSVEMASTATDPVTGLSIRYVRQWVGERSVMINRFDMQLGFGVLLADADSVAIACA